MYKLFLGLFLIVSAPINLAQQSRLSKEVNAISAYIASDYFSTLNKTNHPLSNIDSVYVHALDICGNDIEETLLALTFSFVPYRYVPIVMPFTKIRINFPLTSADLETFNKKNSNIPKELFFDTPVGKDGDNDKPAHFFGSAFISYSSSVFDLGDLIGYFVEHFEETFKVQSYVDQRDIQTNRLGNLFGRLIKRNKNIMPSEVFILKTTMLIRINL